jgi:hypothetical protein
LTGGGGRGMVAGMPGKKKKRAIRSTKPRSPSKYEMASHAEPEEPKWVFYLVWEDGTTDVRCVEAKTAYLANQRANAILLNGGPPREVHLIVNPLAPNAIERHVEMSLTLQQVIDIVTVRLIEAGMIRAGTSRVGVFDKSGIMEIDSGSVSIKWSQWVSYTDREPSKHV